MEEIDRLKWLFSSKGLFIYLLPFLSNSIIKFDISQQFSIGPFGLCFCCTDVNYFMAFLDFTLNCNFISFQYIVYQKYVLNCNQKKLSEVLSFNLNNMQLNTYLYLIAYYLISILLNIIHNFIKILLKINLC